MPIVNPTSSCLSNKNMHTIQLNSPYCYLLYVKNKTKFNNNNLQATQYTFTKRSNIPAIKACGHKKDCCEKRCESQGGS